MECTHDCASCTSSCSSAAPAGTPAKAALCEGASVKKVIAVSGGKGGAGRSVLACLIAAELQRRGKRTGILDADITGASIAHYLGVDEACKDSPDYFFPAVSGGGIQLASVELTLGQNSNPIAWRAATCSEAALTFWGSMFWKDLDVLLLDMPADTGDVGIALYQALPVDGTLLVTKPSLVSVTAALRSGGMSVMSGVPVIGIVENMYSGTEEEYVRKAMANVCRAFNLKNTVKCPCSEAVAVLTDSGRAESADLSIVKEAADLVEAVL